ncbi:MAG: glycoside hydrolase family 88 protein [Oscillospiraceae bacterium]|nr:glycoside hydrolase family 88 protein [Oscillospiraceae bacterium]MCI1990213.1 glycoside hydrolase family 88 protein [Oscillospiraceae bacterium]MCI2035925.1 glycoside hydrolase family 88 protein [Oscillospiraceae bacterium]
MKLSFPSRPCITPEEVSAALDAAVGQVKRNLPQFTYSCQNHSSVNGFYAPCENNQWTCGFWPGEIWLSYEYTGDPVLKYAALILVESFLHRIENRIEVDHHDMGFLYTPSCVAAYKLTGSRDARKAAVLAADRLLGRFQPKGRFLQAWGGMGAKENYRFIIDSLLNVPLLYWASEETGNGRYREIAREHTETCLKYCIRPDNSTCHTFFMNPETGGPDHGATCQGYRDDSAWARGQAWGVYGTALSYRYNRRREYHDMFRRVTQFYLSRLPQDLVPYWDLTFTSGGAEPRDSSSASIAACGFLEMAGHAEREEAEDLRTLAKQIMKSLFDRYRVKDPEKSNGLVLHGTYSKKSPYNTCTPEGVDECVSWGDYFYMEALTRLHKDWDPYW